MLNESGLAAVHAAANLGSKVTAIAPAQTAERVEALQPAAASTAAPKMIGMPESEYTANLAAANADGRAAGAKVATSRIKSIITAPEAKGRESLAHQIAFDTELPLEQAQGMLKAAPEAQKVSRLDGLVPAPKVEASETGTGADSPGARLAASMQKQINRKFGAQAS